MILQSYVWDYPAIDILAKQNYMFSVMHTINPRNKNQVCLS